MKHVGGELVKVGSDVITVDSGAEESVCPQKWGESFGLKAVGPEGKMRMINAAGDAMPHSGNRKVQFAQACF